VCSSALADGHGGLNGQLLAALGAATLERQAPGLGLHTLTKPVCAGALALLGLIRTLHRDGRC